MRIVVALGGNALLRRGEPLTVAAQRRAVARACGPLARLAAEHELVVTHGNGPQVGLLALQAAAYDTDSTYPFDVLGAQTEGMIGYLLEQELGNRLGPSAVVAALVTRVVVSRHDPALDEPTKFVGPVYDDETAEQLVRSRGWTMRRDGGRLRRVVPSPAPVAVLELAPISWMLEKGAVVVCAGGGGIPVLAGPSGRMEGVEAVVDKDLASAVLARELGADLLVVATDVDGVVEGWGTPQARTLAAVHPGRLDPAAFAAGSMRPKVAAAVQAASSGTTTVIGPIDRLDELVAGTAGTRVDRAVERTAYRDE